MIKMPPGRIQHLRLRAQHLHRPDNQPDLNVGRLMAGVFALQAQDAVAAYRSIAEYCRCSQRKCRI